MFFFLQLAQRLEEQHTKHLQIEEELNELHRRKLSDLEEKHEQILSNERHEHENRIQILLNKLDQMKNEVERIQSTTIAERQDLAKKLQDVFETALFQRSSTKTNFLQNEIINSPPPSSSSLQINQIRSHLAEPPSSSLQIDQIRSHLAEPPLSSLQINQIRSHLSEPSSSSSLQINQIKSQLADTQIKGINNEYPSNISTIRSLSSRIDSLVDQTNRVANGFELNSRLTLLSQQQNPSEWIDNNQK